MTDREKMLQKIRRENEESASFEVEVSRVSWTVGAMVGLAIAALIFLFEYLILASYNFGVFLTILSVLSVKFVIKAAKEKTAEYIMLGFLFSIMFIMVVIIYFLSL